MSKRFRHLQYLPFIACMVFPIVGCVPLVVGGAATTTGVGIAQERSMGEAVDDTIITTKIKSDLLQKDFDNLFSHVNVKVTEGRVLLTGSVPKPEMRVEVVRIAWNQSGVKEVINELKIEEPDGKLAVKDYSTDVWITTQLKSKLLFNADIHSVNYSVDTIDGVVYLMGIARSKEELDKVTNIAGTIKYVQRVISYVRLEGKQYRPAGQSH